MDGKHSTEYKQGKAVSGWFIIGTYGRGAAQRTANAFQTVRGSFAKGDSIYPGSKIMKKAHTQIAVRDSSSILHASLVLFR